METLKIEREKLIKVYQQSDTETKSKLEILFGKDNLSISIIERVLTLEDACEVTGKNIETIYGDETDEIEKSEMAIKVFAEALREGKPASECYYYPYFYRSSGGGFSFHGCGSDDGYSGVGARLRVDTYEKAQHMGKCMLSFYKIFITGK